MPRFWEQDQKEINIYITREENPIYGDLKRAMSRMGYKIHPINIVYGTEEDFSVPVRKEKSKLFSELENTLKKGLPTHIPPFLARHVAFYEKSLKEAAVQGVYIPPTQTGALFGCMMTALASDFEKIDAAEGNWGNLEALFDELIKESSVILAARHLEIPVFGSCHGAQLLWYMHGGDLYSLPDYSTSYKKKLKLGKKDISTDLTKFRIEDGCLRNTRHKLGGVYSTTLDTRYQEDDDYESDAEEEPDKDYDHNLLMATPKEKWGQFNAKEHPNMEGGETFCFPPLKSEERAGTEGPSLPKGIIVARSFEFKGCIATQWHPHKNVNTKSSIRYLTQFAQQCYDYKAKQAELEHKLMP